MDMNKDRIDLLVEVSLDILTCKDIQVIDVRPGQIQTYHGIEKIAQILNKKMNMRDTKCEPYRYEYTLMYKGVVFVQVEEKPLEKMYRCIRDLVEPHKTEANSIFVGITDTIKGWRKRATEWANEDDNDAAAETIASLQDDKLMKYIGDIWALEFDEI